MEPTENLGIPVRLFLLLLVVLKVWDIEAHGNSPKANISRSS
jgi:hypothetical protein